MYFSALVRESFWGRLIYQISSHHLFTHREERSGYVIPEKYLSKVADEDAFHSDSTQLDSVPKNSQPEEMIIVTWDGDDDPDNPRNWPFFLKSLFIAEICLLTISVYLASAIYTPGFQYIKEDLNISTAESILPMSVFVFGYGLGPMFWSPMSENASLGRTCLYVSTLFIFFVLQIPTALVQHLAPLVVLRFISGFFASPVLAIGGASMGDVVSPAYLPITITLWSIGANCGPSLGPLIGSIMVVERNWHWTFWFMGIISGISLVISSWFLPETSENTLLLRKAQRLRQLTGNRRIVSQGEADVKHLSFKKAVKLTLWRPIEIALFEPIVFFINIYIALTYSINYLWFEAFPIVFLELYEFNLITFGVTFMSIITGSSVGAFCYIWYLLRTYTKKAKAGDAIEPESFLPAMIVGAFIMPVGILIFGWTSVKLLSWFGPVAGAAIFSFGAFLLFQTAFNYLGASFWRYLASVFAGNALFRSTIAGSFPLFGAPFFNNLATKRFPVAWGCTILGLISTAMTLIPILFYIKGTKLRATSKYSNF